MCHDCLLAIFLTKIVLSNKEKSKNNGKYIYYNWYVFSSDPVYQPCLLLYLSHFIHLSIKSNHRYEQKILIMNINY